MSKKIISLRIEKAKTQKSTVLDLSGLKLNSLPKEIGYLKFLKKIYLNDNELTVLPQELGNLVQLQELNLSNNKLTGLPNTFAKLKKIKRLEVENNLLTSVPRQIRYLTNLQELNFSQNKINGIPQYIGQLTQLEKLDLSHNSIRKLPPNINKLKRLQVFDIAANQLTTLPSSTGNLGSLRQFFLSDNQLNNIPSEIGQLIHLKVLDLRNNHLSYLPESMERLQSLNPNLTPIAHQKGLSIEGNRFNIPAEMLRQEPTGILQYIFDLQASKKNKPLHEAKLIFIGSGYVGKTSLIKKLLEGSFDPMEEQTNGIEINEWSIRRGKDNVKMNVWDFGGQEIMHATHKFFMTSRSLYILVINPRAEDKYGDSEVEYWLKLIRSYGGENVPVIITVNKCETYDIDLPKGEIQDKYSNVISFVKTSCKNDVGIPDLKQAIRKGINHLAHIDDLLPKSYFEIKDTLQERNDDYITYKSYEELCREIDPAFKEESMKTLMALLNDLGIMLNFTDRRLRGTHVLNPEWVTRGVYQVVTATRLIKNKGILRVRDIIKILDPKRYPSEKERSYIMDMMERFELSYQLPNDRDTYFVPGAFPKDRPKNIKWDFEASEELRFQYHYDVLPSSIMSRFIVRIHSFIRQNDYWRNGVIIKKDGCHALIKADPEDRKIFIEIGGKGRKRDLLAYIRGHFDEIHNHFSQIKVESKIPVSHESDVVLDYEALLYYEEMNLREIPVKPFGMIDVRKLLDGIDGDRLPKNRPAVAPSAFAQEEPTSPIDPTPSGEVKTMNQNRWLYPILVVLGLLSALSEFSGYNLKEFMPMIKEYFGW